MLLCVILREKSGLVASLFKFVTEKLISRKRHSLPNTNTQNSWKHAFVQPRDTIILQYCPRYLEKLLWSSFPGLEGPVERVFLQ